MDAIDLMNHIKASSTSSFHVSEWRQKCYDAMNDDFNSPILIANLFDAVKYINQINDKIATVSTEDLELLKQTLTAFTFDILGLVNASKESTDSDKLAGAVEILINLRKEARLNKDFALSDRIREQLAEAGIQLNDSREGTTFSVN